MPTSTAGTAEEIREYIIYKIIDCFLTGEPEKISYLESILDEDELKVFRKILNFYGEVAQ